MITSDKMILALGQYYVRLKPLVPWRVVRRICGASEAKPSGEASSGNEQKTLLAVSPGMACQFLLLSAAI
jgi:hypothetical protein